MGYDDSAGCRAESRGVWVVITIHTVVLFVSFVNSVGTARDTIQHDTGILFCIMSRPIRRLPMDFSGSAPLYRHCATTATLIFPLSSSLVILPLITINGRKHL